jgi:hypothetical protein
MADGKLMGVYVECGKVKIFTIAPQWPGWSRSGRDEAQALQAMLACSDRYAAALAETGLDFQPPADAAHFEVLGRVPGNSTTDFGAPDARLPGDELPVDDAELARMTLFLKAGWRAFDRAAAEVVGKTLRMGPRGGGRDLVKMLAHVRGGEEAYLVALGGKPVPAGSDDAVHRDAMLAALARSARGEIPERGPRGGLRWTPRFFTRRAVWHALDHAWEIEDRVE